MDLSNTYFSVILTKFYSNVLKIVGFVHFSIFRKGKSDSYRDEMNLDYIQKFDEWDKRCSNMKRSQ